MDLDTKLFELLRHEIAGPGLLERQLRVLVKFTAPFGKVTMEIGDAIDDRLEALLSLYWKIAY